MTGPTPDTPREAELRGMFTTLSTEQQETLTSARGAVDRLAAKATALEEKVADMEGKTVDDETLTEFGTMAGELATAANEAQAAFDKVGVESPEPPEGEQPAPAQARRRGK